MMRRPLLTAALLIAFLPNLGLAGAQATPVSEAAACGTPSGWLLTQAPPSADRQSAVTLIDAATMNAVDQIDLPPVDAAFPTPLPGVVVAVSGTRLYLIDAIAGRATPIPLPDGDARGLSPNPVQFRGSAGERFLLLGSSSFERALLIDLERATAIDLTALTGVAGDTPVFVSFAAITPGDDHVVFWDGQHVYLAETSTPSAATRLDSGAFAFAPESSPDGREIVFSQSEGPGSGSAVMVHDVSTGQTRELIRRDRALVTLWAPGGRTLLVDARTESGAAAGRVTLLNVDTLDERALLAYSGSLTTVQFNPDGTRALLGVERIDGGAWHLADLNAATTDEQPQLGGSRIWPGLYGDTRWAFAVSVGDAGGPLSGPAYRAIDLDTGVVARLLTRDPSLTYADPPVLSPDGRFALISATGSADSTTWLLDAEAVDATELPGGRALFSPDGCFVVSESEDSGLTVMPANASELATTIPGSGRLLGWLAP